MMLSMPERIQVDLLQQALALVVTNYQALRIRLVPLEQDKIEAAALACAPTAAFWQQRVLASEHPEVEIIDLANLAEEALHQEIERVVAEKHQTLHLIDGPIVRLVVIRIDGSHTERLLLIVHHIAVDSYSFELVLNDLMRVYDQLAAGQPPLLLSPKASYRAWMQALMGLAASNDVQQSASYWLDQPTGASIQAENSDGGNTQGDYAAQSFWLTREVSHQLLRAIPATTGLPTSTLMLATLLQTLYAYTGQAAHQFALVHHGRSETLPNLDLSRSVGWMSVNYDMVLELMPILSPIQQAETIQQQLSKLKRNGLDQGLLRYMHSDPNLRRAFVNAPQSQVKFNWYGQTQSLMQPLFERYPLAPEAVGLSVEAEQEMSYQFHFSGWVINGCIHLEAGSSNARYTDETRAQVASIWRQAIEKLTTDTE